MGLRLGRNPCPISALLGLHHCHSQQGIHIDSWEICSSVQLYNDECKNINCSFQFWSPLSRTPRSLNINMKLGHPSTHLHVLRRSEIVSSVGVTCRYQTSVEVGTNWSVARSIRFLQEMSCHCKETSLMRQFQTTEHFYKCNSIRTEGFIVGSNKTCTGHTMRRRNSTIFVMCRTVVYIHKANVCVCIINRKWFKFATYASE
jgi:hypothetical protein